MEAAGTLLKITTSGLESYIFDVIQQRLGHYIQNLTREQLNVSGWAGDPIGPGGRVDSVGRISR